MSADYHGGATGMLRPRRRCFLSALAAAWAGVLMPAPLAAVRVPRGGATSDFCAITPAFATPLRTPGADGLMARLALSDAPVILRAVAASGTGPSLAFESRVGERTFVNPTLVARRGGSVRIRVVNELAEPTIVHWHGLSVDTANDGNGDTVIAPGAAYDYAFTVRDRASLYWYHPHPHGATASQINRGLFGLIAVEDDEETALRAALALTPGESEIPLVLHDQRSDTPWRYAPNASDLEHGWYGDETLVNFTAKPHFDVARRRYRFRILNAANARNYRLAVRLDDGTLLPFLLLGTDGGLLEMPQTCREVFVSPAERVDLLVDFSALDRGGFALLESLSFDPMNGMLMPESAGPGAGAGDAHAMAADETGGHAMRAQAESHHAPTGKSLPDGAPMQLLQFRVRGAPIAAPPPPPRLSAMPPPAPAIDVRALRLGFAKGRWRINDRVFEMGATPIVVSREMSEIWLIRNYYASMPHAMHLHGFHFRVIERETSPAQLAPLVAGDKGRLATDLGWKDTVLVWPGESVRVAVDFRHPFPGDQIYLFHCHNLEHEDGGMMLRVKVA